MNRYYDPNTGRYITADPIGLAGGVNLFLYTANDPVNFVDPYGLWAAWGGVTAVGAIGTRGGTAGTGGSIGDNSNGRYATAGPAVGVAASVGVEAGFYTGDISGETTTLTIGYLGLIWGEGGNFGLSLTGSVGLPFELTLARTGGVLDPCEDVENEPAPISP